MHITPQCLLDLIVKTGSNRAQIFNSYMYMGRGSYFVSAESFVSNSTESSLMFYNDNEATIFSAL